MGLDDFLELKGKVSKSDVLSYIMRNTVQIREVQKGVLTPEGQAEVDEAKEKAAKADAKFRRLAQDEIEKRLSLSIESARNAADMLSAEIVTGSRSSAEVLNDRFRNVGGGATSELQQAGRDLFNHTGDVRRIRKANQTPTKYESYTLPGEKKNYQELLLTLPRAKQSPEWQRVYDEREKVSKEMSRWVRGDNPDNPGGTSDAFGTPEYEAAKKHYDEMQERFMALDRQLPALDRRQPDFTSSHFDEHNILAHVRLDERVDADGKPVLFVEEVQSDWHQKGKKVGYANSPDEALAEQKRMETEAQNRNKVPNAPFKKDWHELAMKTVLRKAAEKGFDKVAWVTGQQTADRYDLSKQVDRLFYGQRSHSLEAYKDDKLVIQHTVPEDQLADYIGKDAAQKLLAIKPDDFGSRTLSGAELKVGGEWAKRLYDQAIPNFLSKYGKKWGAKVGDTTLAPSDAVWNDLGRATSPNTPSQQVHSISITPEMKASVMYEGQPLFKAAAGPIAPSDAKKVSFELKQPGNGLPNYLRVSPEAISAIGRALRVRMRGVNMAVSNALNVAAVLDKQADTLENLRFTEAAGKLRALGTAMRDNADEHDGLTIVGQDSTHSEELRIVREELFHAVVQRRPGKGDVLQGVPWREVYNDPGFMERREELAEHFESLGLTPHPATLTAEAVVDFMTGDDFGNIRRAKLSVIRYFEAARKLFGDGPLRDATAIFEFLDKEAVGRGIIKPGEEFDAGLTGATRDTLQKLRSEGNAPGRGAEVARGSQGTSGEAKPREPEGSRASGTQNADSRSGEIERSSKTPEGTDTNLHAAATPGLTDEELELWSKSKGFRTEPAGEQLGMFGDNEAVHRVFRIGAKGKEQAGLVYQSQLDKLKQGPEAPTEPFTLQFTGEQVEEQPRLFGAGDLGEIIGPGKNQKPTLPSTRNNGGDTLFSGTSGTFTPAALNPQRIQQNYERGVEQFLGKHKLSDKYFTVREHDPKIADDLQLVDNAPRYFREKAATNLAKVIKGLSEDQIRLVSMMVDSDSRDYLEQHKPQEFRQATQDIEVMKAVHRFEPLQDELTADRQALGWPVRKSLAVEEDPTSANPFVVKDRDGNSVADFKTQKQAQNYVDQNATIEPHLKRTYPEHSKNPLPAETGAGPFTGTFYGEKGLRPPKMDKKARIASAEYHYEHGRKDFSGYIESFKQAKEAMLKQQLFDDFTDTATAWKAGTAQPSKITYGGKDYYRPDLVLKAREGGTTLPSYGVYDPSRGERFLIKTPDWSTLTTGKPGIGPNDRWLGPKAVVDALEQYDASRGAEGAGKFRKFIQEQIVGLFGPVVHVNNIVRHMGQMTATGAFDPRSWSSISRLIFSKNLREQALQGVDDSTVDWLTKHGHYTDWRDIGNMNAYIGGNLNPANWVRAFGKNVLFNPKFAGGWGGLDPKARIIAKEWFDDHMPGLTDQQIGERIDDAFGAYNRANWTERTKQIARFTLFPGWDVSSAKWFLRHPWKAGFAGAALILAINYAMHKEGLIKGDDWVDTAYLHWGDRKFRTGVISDSIGQHFVQPALSGIEAAVKGEDVASGVAQGTVRGAAALSGQLAGPAVEMVADQLYNRKYAGGVSQIVEPEDRNIPGTWAPNREIEKRIAFAALKGAPALQRFIDPKGQWDWKQGLGSALGITNYKYGAEERLKANVAKSMGYSQTLSTLAEREPEAAQKFVNDPQKSVYLMFHTDLDEIAKDLKDLDKETERVKMAGDIFQNDRKNTLTDMAETRKNILDAADALNDALQEAKAQAGK